jgi:ATP-binding cassette subfamily B protein
MQHHSAIARDADARRPSVLTPRNDWAVIRTLLPYLWEFKWRVILALTFLVSAKLANVAVPLVMKQIVDGLDARQACWCSRSRCW